jgi:hypothetical protein
MGEMMNRLTVDGIKGFLDSRASNDADSTVRDLMEMIADDKKVFPDTPKEEPKPAKSEKPKKGILRSSRKDD